MARILYVEDNFQNFRLVSRMLQSDPAGPYQVDHAENGEVALTIARDTRPDLILMDINLPDVDGMEVTRRIKADPGLCSVPVIALTANAMVGDRERFLEAGCDGYLCKPISRIELREVLAQFLGGAPA